MKTNKQQNNQDYPSDKNIPKNPNIPEIAFNFGDKSAHKFIRPNKKMSKFLKFCTGTFKLT